MLYAYDFRKTASEALSGRWGTAIGTGFVAGLFGIGGTSGGTSHWSSNGSNNLNTNDINNFMGNDLIVKFNPIITLVISIIVVLALLSFFVGGAIQLGYCRFNLNLIDDTNPRFNDLFSKFDIFWKAFGLRFVIGLYTFLWTLLLIIPGIIAALSYQMAPYIMEENPSMGINEAIEYSKDMMYGNKWRLFCLGFSFIGWGILCLFTCGIGLFWLYPYINAANAAFYREVSGKNIIVENK